MRNIPFQKSEQIRIEPISRESLGWSDNDFILVNQGTGINVDRGMEELVDSLPLMPDNVKLLLVGKGDVIPDLEKRVNMLGLTSRVQFIPPLPYSEMLRYTQTADLGVSIDKDTNINYRYSLPNKIFDYIHSGLPVLISDLIEPRKILEEYPVGRVCPEVNPHELAKSITLLMEDGIAPYLQALKEASRNLTWEGESQPLLKAYQDVLKQAPINR
jgi:glycosyltransferase involved in cell wall biosynthesis